MDCENSGCAGQRRLKGKNWDKCNRKEGGNGKWEEKCKVLHSLTQLFLMQLSHQNEKISPNSYNTLCIYLLLISLSTLTRMKVP